MNEKYLIPLSVVIAGIIIGGALFFGLSNQQQVVQAPANNNAQAQAPQNQNPDIKKVSDATDHIFGNKNADLFVVEYSDIECPFCKRYHDNVLTRLKEEYKGNDRISFVFRHFPLDAPFTRELHPTATEAAVATECVAQLGGDEKFFEYISALFGDTTTAQARDAELLAKFSTHAESVGINKTAFENCFASDDQTKVAADFQDGQRGGVQGTPTVFMQQADGTTFLAVADYNVLKQAIDVFLAGN